MRNAYSTILDKIEKNYDKLVDPKGASSRMQHELMYSFVCSTCKVEMKLRYSVDFQLTFKITMKEDIKEQYRIISWKNKIVVKRNPRELAMDILYSP